MIDQFSSFWTISTVLAYQVILQRPARFPRRLPLPFPLGSCVSNNAWSAFVNRSVVGPSILYSDFSSSFNSFLSSKDFECSVSRSFPVKNLSFEQSPRFFSWSQSLTCSAVHSLTVARRCCVGVSADVDGGAVLVSSWLVGTTVGPVVKE